MNHKRYNFLMCHRIVYSVDIAVILVRLYLTGWIMFAVAQMTVHDY
jgi:hypothetical protein